MLQRERSRLDEVEAASAELSERIDAILTTAAERDPVSAALLRTYGAFISSDLSQEVEFCTGRARRYLDSPTLAQPSDRAEKSRSHCARLTTSTAQSRALLEDLESELASLEDERGDRAAIVLNYVQRSAIEESGVWRNYGGARLESTIRKLVECLGGNVRAHEIPSCVTLIRTLADNEAFGRFSPYKYDDSRPCAVALGRGEGAAPGLLYSLLTSLADVDRPALTRELETQLDSGDRLGSTMVDMALCGLFEFLGDRCAQFVHRALENWTRSGQTSGPGLMLVILVRVKCTEAIPTMMDALESYYEKHHRSGNPLDGGYHLWLRWQGEVAKMVPYGSAMHESLAGRSERDLEPVKSILKKTEEIRKQRERRASSEGQMKSMIEQRELREFEDALAQSGLANPAAVRLLAQTVREEFHEATRILCNYGLELQCPACGRPGKPRSFETDCACCPECGESYPLGDAILLFELLEMDLVSPKTPESAWMTPLKALEWVKTGGTSSIGEARVFVGSSESELAMGTRMHRAKTLVRVGSDRFEEREEIEFEYQ